MLQFYMQCVAPSLLFSHWMYWKHWNTASLNCRQALGERIACAEQQDWLKQRSCRYWQMCPMTAVHTAVLRLLTLPPAEECDPTQKWSVKRINDDHVSVLNTNLLALKRRPLHTYVCFSSLNRITSLFQFQARKLVLFTIVCWLGDRQN